MATVAELLAAEVEADDEGAFEVPGGRKPRRTRPAILEEIESALALGATAVHVVARRDAIVVHSRVETVASPRCRRSRSRSPQ